jgi:hypothetical protein
MSSTTAAPVRRWAAGITVESTCRGAPICERGGVSVRVILVLLMILGSRIRLVRRSSSPSDQATPKREAVPTSRPGRRSPTTSFASATSPTTSGPSVGSRWTWGACRPGHPDRPPLAGVGNRRRRSGPAGHLFSVRPLPPDRFLPTGRPRREPAGDLGRRAAVTDLTQTCR